MSRHASAVYEFTSQARSGLAGFALMSAAVSAFWLNIQKPAALPETPAAPAE